MSTAYQTGQAVQVWSNSSGSYIPGTVMDVVLAGGKPVYDRGELVPVGSIFVEYGPSVKWIMEKDIGKLLKPATNTSSAPSKTPNSNSGPGLIVDQIRMCKWSCGCQVQPGLTRNLNPYDSCCKKCAMSQGGGEHDVNCPGKPGQEMTKSQGGKIARESAAWSVKELAKLAKTTSDIQGLCVNLLDRFGGKGSQSLNWEQMKACYDYFCMKALIDDNWDEDKNKIKAKDNKVEASEMLEFFRELVRVNLAENLKPEKLEVKRQLLIRKQEGKVEDFYVVGKKLGEGSFGSVALVTTKHAGDQRVCKTIKLSEKHNSGNSLNELLGEISMMSEIDHPSVLKVYEYYLTPKEIRIILEIAEGGELWDHLKVHEKDPGPAKELWTYKVILQILRALAFMHNKPRIAHKDLKPENILFVSKDSDTIKVIDFGLAEAFSKGQKTSNQQCGTPLFSAPEILLEKRFDFRVDVWSAGVIMYHCLQSSAPFPAKTMAQLKEMVCDNKPPVPKYPGLSPECLDVCWRMMQKVNDRPTASDILQHKWFKIMGQKVEEAITKISPGVVQILENYHRQPEIKKAIYYYVAYFANFGGYTEGIRQLFTHLDTANSGTLYQDDLKHLLMKAGLKRSLAGGIAHSLCRRKDPCSSGSDRVSGDSAPSVGYTEFVAAIISVRVATKHHEIIEQAFSTFDTGKKGYVLKEDFRNVFAITQRSNAEEKMINEIFLANDADGNPIDKMMSEDCRLDFATFLSFMQKTAQTSSGDSLKAV